MESDCLALSLSKRCGTGELGSLASGLKPELRTALCGKLESKQTLLCATSSCLHVILEVLGNVYSKTLEVVSGSPSCVRVALICPVILEADQPWCVGPWLWSRRG